MTDRDTTQSDLAADQLARIVGALRLGLVTMVDDPPEERDDRNVVDALYHLSAEVREGTKAIVAELSAISYALGQNRPTDWGSSDPGRVYSDDRR